MNRFLLTLSLLLVLASHALVAADTSGQPQTWREEFLLIDLHQHVTSIPEHLDRAVRIMDQVGVGIAVNLSGGTVTPNQEAREFFAKHWRWLQTNDRDCEHMTPIQGDWTINAVGLPASVLKKIYFENARKLLARSLPAVRE
jgi:hypothetical protein